jgi:hypothetical protein
MIQPSAKGAKCESLGHRPRTSLLKIESAEGAEWKIAISTFVNWHKNFFPENIPRLQRCY